MKNFILENNEKNEILGKHKGVIRKELFPYVYLNESVLTSDDADLNKLIADKYVSGGDITKDFDGKTAYSANTVQGNQVFFYGNKTYTIYKKGTKDILKKGKFKNSEIDDKLKNKSSSATTTSDVVTTNVGTNTNVVNKPAEDPTKKLGIPQKLNLNTPTVDDLANKYGKLGNTQQELSPQDVFNSYLRDKKIFKDGRKFKSKVPIGTIPNEDLQKLNQYFTDNNYKAKLGKDGDQGKDKRYGKKYVWIPKEVETEIQETFITDKLMEMLSEKYEPTFHSSSDLDDAFSELVDLLDEYGYDKSDLINSDYEQLLMILEDVIGDMESGRERNELEMFYEELEELLLQNQEEDTDDFDLVYEDIYGSVENINLLLEAEYQGRKVQLGKIMQGDVKKFKVYVKNDKGKVVKVNFGFGGKSAKGKRMPIRKRNPERRKSFRARHRCDNPGPRWKPRYWACRTW